MGEYLRNKTVLVTGGTGSIGKALVKQILSFNPDSIRVLSRDEYSQYCFRRELTNDGKVRFLLGDIRDKERLRLAMDSVDYVFNAAALKQVPSCEFNPFEAVKTNVIGTQNIIEVAMETGVEKVILVSTDKVVNPINTMGTTKLLAEKLMRSANFYKGPRETVFSCVRFGNVLGTRGSVIPLFLSQLKNSNPITLTHDKMTRFVMTLPKAVHLVLKAGELAKDGETFILRMPAIRILDLVAVLNGVYAERHGWKPVKIVETGIREGEKMHEDLLFSHEVNYASLNEEMIVVGFNRLGTEISQSLYRSEYAPYLDQHQIFNLLQEIESDLEIL
ncbi:MAG: polysaccharide biosynthesis protein [bacterium]|nr:polysaccharide biosynthesis protein [bacterium]